VTLTAGSFVLLLVVLPRAPILRPTWGGLDLAERLAGVPGALADRSRFAGIVARPDNVPIVGLVYLLAFFLWLGASLAVANDDRQRLGKGPPRASWRARSWCGRTSSTSS